MSVARDTLWERIVGILADELARLISAKLGTRAIVFLDGGRYDLAVYDQGAVIDTFPEPERLGPVVGAWRWAPVMGLPKRH